MALTLELVGFGSGIQGGSVLQYIFLLANHHGGARVDNDRAGNVRAPLLDTPRGCLLVVSLDEYDEWTTGWMDG